jgi:prepilin-type processing-associated H-X9-DG protein
MKTSHEKRAFTRLDLMALIGICALLIVLGLPALGENGAGSEAVICQNNLRQMVRAFHFYAADNADYFMPVTDANNPPPGNWLFSDMNTSGTEATNGNLLISSTNNILAPYLGGNSRVFKCPADPSVAIFGGIKYPRARSISFNHAVGTQPLYKGGDGKRATDGAWLDDNHSHTANLTFRCYARFSEMVNPKPSGLFLFLDEGPTSINDAIFATTGPGVDNSRWIDWPAAYHRGAGGISFADGHAELHTWTTFGLLSTNALALSPSPPTVDDIQWLTTRATARVADAP